MRSVACSPRKDAEFIDTLAAAFAEIGDFASAVRFEKRAREFLAPESSEAAENRLKMYESNRPFRQDVSDLKHD